LLPAKAKRYIEAFAGGASVFLQAEYPSYILSDINADLMATYICLDELGDKFIRRCERLFVPENDNAEAYGRLRDEFNDSDDVVRKSEILLYLNRFGFNGLFRVNRAGQFNVPFGAHNGVPYFPRVEMEQFLAKLRAGGVELEVEDFRVTLSAIGPGDSCYCDPPYLAASSTANFTSYSSNGFTLKDQQDLARLAEQAAARGATVVVSNADVPLARELYRGASKIISRSVNRSISCVGSGRGKAQELLAVCSK
jgi:DNA adenine methylase